jgi:hypothetical protein
MLSNTRERGVLSLERSVVSHDKFHGLNLNISNSRSTATGRAFFNLLFYIDSLTAVCMLMLVAANSLLNFLLATVYFLSF